MAESWWDTFSNNLATDLAPFVALLGESPTKQYLSECLTVEDIIIFALGPLGVITAIVSAIRVCGTPSLRAFVGRAQEGAGTAEAELCSSTSRDVCELYNNGGIARVLGRPKILEIIYDPDASYEEFYARDLHKAKAGIYSFQDYLETENGKSEWKTQLNSYARRNENLTEDNKRLAEGDVRLAEEGARSTEEDARYTTKGFAPNPNLSLNIGIRPVDHAWFRAAAILGILLQAFVLVWAVLTRYHFQWTRSRREDDYAVPLVFFGTVILCLGMALCAQLIESKTRESIYRRSDASARSTMYWVQPGNQTIGDQVFDSFAYSDNLKLRKYIMSWKDTSEHPTTLIRIWTAVSLTTVGFICQFLGIRACHSSVAVVQLGVTIIMSLIRAGLRTQRLRREDNLMVDNPELFQGHELDSLAMKIGRGGNEPDNTPQNDSWNIFSHLIDGDNATADRPEIVINPGVSLQQLEKLPLLSGFQIINPKSINTQNLLDLTEEKLLNWIATMYCLTDDREVPDEIKRVFFRARLARMTGLENTEPDHSSYWGDRFVPVRRTALILADAIEETMKIIFSSHSQSSIRLHESWEQAFAIFWRLQCSANDIQTGTPEKNDLQMSLRRSIDQNGIPDGPWKVNSSEIEAVLGLWLWSLKQPCQRLDGERKGPKKADQRISRILLQLQDPDDEFSETQELNIWREKGGVKIQKRQLQIKEFDGALIQNAVRWKENEEFVTNTIMLPDSNDQRRFFGWYNVKEGPPCNTITVLEVPSKNNLELNCAQEIYCNFLMAIMQVVRDFGQDTVDGRHKDFRASNMDIEAIQQALIRGGLCDTDDAFACTIPILRNQHKINTPSRIISEAADLADQYWRKNEWENFEKLVNWNLRHSYSKLYMGDYEATNDFRLSLLRTCESYRQALTQNDIEKKGYGWKGILGLLKQYSHNQRVIQTQLIWTDSGTVPSDNDKRNINLVDTIRSYSIAALWSMQNGKPPEEQQRLQTELQINGMPPIEQQRLLLTEPGNSMDEVERGQIINTEGDLLGAIRRRNLIRTLYLLGHRDYPLGEPQKTRSLIHASQSGWYMVVEAVACLDTAINQEEDGRTALSHAAELGDVNTVRVLIKNGADMRIDRYWEAAKPLLPIHYAAKNGYAVIVRDLIRKWNGSESDEEDHDGMTPLSWAITSGNPASVQVLLSNRFMSPNHYHTERPALHLAVKEGKEDMVDVLLKHERIDPNLDTMKYISSPCPFLNGERVNADCPGHDKRPALWWAAALGLESFVQKLLSSGKVHHPDMSDRLGITPLSMAVATGHLGVVRQLREFLKQAAKLDLRAILIAAKNGRIHVVEELLPMEVKIKGRAQALLERYGLGNLWPRIQNSEAWGRVGGQDAQYNLESIDDPGIPLEELNWLSEEVKNAVSWKPDFDER